MSLSPITPRAAIEAIADALAADLPVMLWGPPGVGKSQIAQAVANAAFDGNMVDIRLSQYDPAELGGIPVPDMQRKVTEWFRDAILPGPHSAPRGILFLDEITSAPQIMQAAAYQLVLDRAFRGHALPPGWRVMAAGNRTTDRGVAFSMPAPLANRFSHLLLDPADESLQMEWVKDWVVWASAASLNSVVSAFIQFRPQALFVAPRPGDQAFPTPRAWEMVGKHLDAAEQQGRDPSRALILGTVGAAEGTAFLAFLEHRRDVPSMVDIIADPMRCTCPGPKNLGAKFFVLGMLSRRLNADNAAPVFKYIDRLGEEIASAAVTLMPQAVRFEIGATRAYTDWIVKHQHLLAA